ncbi:hypothetical protein, variant [Capsaspora owczarzaki ATCC 30864]|nr:hypothetical protein, variant [Capsaspora owczarzaki ATCC 30864]
MGNKITTVGPNAFGATFSGLTYLGLNLNPITSMADSAFSGAPNIGGLPLNDMLLTSLPVGALSSLKLLMLLAVRTPIQAISEDFRAPFATVVLFDSNQLSTLPSNMGTIFPSASQLAISNNLFESVPYEVSNMPNLGILSVDGNRIRSLQNQLTLTNLIGLTANHNQLTSLTVSDLVGYPNLMALQAANNSISYIEPGLLSSRPNMLYMMLANNSLTTLPPGLYQGSTSALLQNPTYNRLDGNPFIGQPPSTWGTVAQPIPCNAQCATCFAGTSSDCCPANCLQCTSNTTCNVCYDGYEKMGGVCAINYHAISTSVDAVASALAASVASVESVASIASVASVESAVSVASVASAVSAASVSSASVAAVAASLESVASVESVASAASVQSVLAVAASLESLLASQSAMSLASVASVASIQAIAPSSSEAAVLATSSTHAAALVSSAAATTGTTASGGLASNASASSGSSIGIVIGCVVGGVVLLLLLIVLISRRRSRKTKLVHHYDRDNGIVAEEVSYARIAGASLNKDSDTPIYDSTTPQVTYAQVNDAPHVYASTNAAHYDVLSTESKQVANYDVLSPQQANYEEIRTSSVKVV